MTSRSAADADQVLFAGNPRNGGGPLHSISTESTYNGAGLRVDRTDRRFEIAASFTASSALVGGAAGLFTCPPSCKSASEPSFELELPLEEEVEEEGLAGGLPNLGLVAGAARDLGWVSFRSLR